MPMLPELLLEIIQHLTRKSVLTLSGASKKLNHSADHHFGTIATSLIQNEPPFRGLTKDHVVRFLKYAHVDFLVTQGAVGVEVEKYFASNRELEFPESRDMMCKMVSYSMRKRYFLEKSFHDYVIFDNYFSFSYALHVPELREHLMQKLPANPPFNLCDVKMMTSIGESFLTHLRDDTVIEYRQIKWRRLGIKAKKIIGQYILSIDGALFSHDEKEVLSLETKIVDLSYSHIRPDIFVITEAGTACHVDLQSYKITPVLDNVVKLECRERVCFALLKNGDVFVVPYDGLAETKLAYTNIIDLYRRGPFKEAEIVMLAAEKMVIISFNKGEFIHYIIDNVDNRLSYNMKRYISDQGCACDNSGDHLIRY